MITQYLHKLNISNTSRYYLLALCVAMILSFFSTTLLISSIVASLAIILLLPLGNKGLITRSIIFLALAASFNSILGIFFGHYKFHYIQPWSSGYILLSE